MLPFRKAKIRACEYSASGGYSPQNLCESIEDYFSFIIFYRQLEISTREGK
jgi:hypothetical protein